MVRGVMRVIEGGFGRSFRKEQPPLGGGFQADQRSPTDRESPEKIAEKISPKQSKSNNPIVTTTSPGLEIVRVPISVSGWRDG